MKITKTVAIAIAGFAVAGLLLFISSFYGLGDRANPALSDALFPTKRVIGALIFVGSTLTLLAGARWKRKTTGWQIAVFGLPIATAGWAYYTFSLIITDSLALFPIPLGIGLTAAYVSKLFDVFSEEKITTKNVEALENGRTP